MDWNLKAPPSWDFTELEQETFSNLDTVNGSNSFGVHKPGREDFSVDLKLGQVGNLGNDLVDAWKEPGRSKPASSPSGSSKRSRGSYNASQAASCLVDGCNADLSCCREYHRRHKVCELHSKTPQVTIGGHKQRFCQQCSRFHSLEEFDEGKRSCRKRLDGHNRRRRKPQPEPFSRYGSLLSNFPSTQLLPFSSSLVYPSTPVVNPSWGGVAVKTEADSGLHGHPPHLPFLDKQNVFFNSSPATSMSYKGANYNNNNNNKPFPLLQGHNPATMITSPEVSSCHSLLRTFPPPETSSVADRSKLVLYDRLTTPTPPPQVQSSDCALSLLSSPQTSEMGLGHHNMSTQLASIPLVQASGLEPMSSVLVPNGSGSALHCPGTFHHLGSDGSSNEESHQILPSHWG